MQVNDTDEMQDAAMCIQYIEKGIEILAAHALEYDRFVIITFPCVNTYICVFCPGHLLSL